MAQMEMEQEMELNELISTKNTKQSNERSKTNLRREENDVIMIEEEPRTGVLGMFVCVKTVFYFYFRFSRISSAQLLKLYL